MTLFVACVVVMWVLLVGMVGWHVWQARRAKAAAALSYLEARRRLVAQARKEGSDGRSDGRP